jgi:hypothetical protein
VNGEGERDRERRDIKDIAAITKYPGSATRAIAAQGADRMAFTDRSIRAP